MVRQFMQWGVAAGVLLGAASTSLADLAAYSQNFEALNQASSTALSDDGWQVFGNVFDPVFNYLYGYGPFPAPNGGPAFSSITTGEGGAAQGNQQLVTYSDYNNGDHGNGNLIESNFYREWTVGTADVGSTWTFTFDAKLGDLVSPSTATAFIKTLDPANGYALTNFLTFDTGTLPATWSTHSIPINIDGSLDGQILQIGFLDVATNYNASGMVYDNINFVPEPASCALLGIGLMLLRRRRA